MLACHRLPRCHHHRATSMEFNAMPTPSKNRHWRWRLLSLMLALSTAYLLYLALSLALLPAVADLKDRRHNLTVEIRDWQGTEHSFLLGPGNPRWTPLERIPAAMKWAVVVAEDARFYQHQGIDLQALRQALEYDLKQKRLARGASTITQQLAKNLYLSREKTLTRKLKEFYLAYRLEQELSKERILELYLNLIEVGPLVHGVGEGARFYFGKPASALTTAECAFLAAMLPGPRLAYNPYRNLAKVDRRADKILRFMRQRGVLSEVDYQLALASRPNIAGLQRKVDQSLVELGAEPASTTEELVEDDAETALEETASGSPAPQPAAAGNESEELEPATTSSAAEPEPAVAPPPPAAGD